MSLSTHLYLLMRMVGGLLVLGALSSSQLWAHGDFPYATSLIPGAEGSEQPLIVSNFGVFVVEETGQWAWLCDEVLRSTGDLGTLAVTPDDVWMAGGFYGVYRSEDHCTWDYAENELQSLYVTQVTMDSMQSGQVFASTSSGGKYNALWVSTDSGKSFQVFQDFGEGSTVRSFAMAETGPAVAVVGWRGGFPYLWYSADRSTWVEAELPSGAGILGYYVLGVDGVEGLSYLRQILDEVQPGVPTEALLAIDESGELSSLLTMTDAITAFALEPGEGLLEVGGRSVGLYRSFDGGESFESPVVSPTAGCLSTVDGQHYQCANNYSDGAAVMSISANGELAPYFEFGSVKDVIECESGTDVTNICEPLWEDVKQTVGFDAVEESPTPTPTSAAPTEAVEVEGCEGCSSQGGAPSGGGLLAMGLFLLRSYRRRLL